MRRGRRIHRWLVAQLQGRQVKEDMLSVEGILSTTLSCGERRIFIIMYLLVDSYYAVLWGLFGNGSVDTVTRHLGLGQKLLDWGWKRKYQSSQLRDTNNYNSHAT